MTGETLPPPLLDALDRLRATGPEFDGFLANHGPMVAEGLVQLGHCDRVPDWVEHYRNPADRRPGGTARDRPVRVAGASR